MTHAPTTIHPDNQWIHDVGQPAYAAIEEMVNAMQADRERLEELRELRDEWLEEDLNRTKEDWPLERCITAQELDELTQAVTLDGQEIDEETARERIEEDPLSIRIFGERINGEWEATNYEILLSTGGPASRIVGDLNQDGEPDNASLEVQDWFKPWTLYPPANTDVPLAYASCFYFGE